MKMLTRLAHHAPMMNTNPTNFFKRAPRSDSQGKRQTPPNRRAFDPIAYAAALEVLG
jgi:hypothetical protein